MYEGYHASQKRVQQAHFFPEKIREAMKQLPNIKTILATADGAHNRYVAEMQKFLPTCYLPCYQHCGRPSIADTTSSIWSAAESVDLRCQHFLSQCIDLQSFGQIDNKIASLSMLHLQSMNLDIKLTRGDNEEDESINTEVLEKGGVLDLVTSAPNLQHLSLTFNTWNYEFTDIPFDKSIGGSCWPFLKAVSLVGLCSHEHELRDFFGRHARTLKYVSLKDMHQDEGLWHMTFQDMRRAFGFGQQLETCTMSGYFSSRTSGITDIGEDTVISDYVQATGFGDISLNEYCEMIGVPPY